MLAGKEISKLVESTGSGMEDLLNHNNDFGIYERKKGQQKHYYLGRPGDVFPQHDWMEHIATYVPHSIKRSQIDERKKADEFKEAKTGLRKIASKLITMAWLALYLCKRQKR